MPKFITVHNKSDGAEVDVNMDHAESFALASDPLQGTKIFSYEPRKEMEDRCYWRVVETPEEIRQLLRTSVYQVLHKKENHGQ